MDKKYLFAALFLGILVILGGVFIYRIPASAPKQLSQDTSTSANISGTGTDTLGAETLATPEASVSAKQNMDNKLVIQDEVIGTGSEAVTGKKVTVNYTGTLTNGTKFDSSYDRSQPFSFTLGAGEVIQGWDQGVAGMKVGGKRKLTIPPALGYGSQDMGSIPPNSTLVFEVELLKVE
jgi:FKBP-type peptidyl-prolyl cis-trans isomerase